MKTIKSNLTNGALTEYTGFPFVSMCMFNGRPIGAGADGIFLLDSDGNMDVYTSIEDERSIDAFVEFPISSLGIDRIKQGRRLYIGGKFKGPMQVVSKTFGASEQSNTYNAIPRNAQLVQHVFEMAMSFQQRSEYWKFTVKNVNGSDFSLDFIDGTFLPMVRRMGP